MPDFVGQSLTPSVFVCVCVGYKIRKKKSKSPRPHRHWALQNSKNTQNNTKKKAHEARDEAKRLNLTRLLVHSYSVCYYFSYSRHAHIYKFLRSSLYFCLASRDILERRKFSTFKHFHNNKKRKRVCNDDDDVSKRAEWVYMTKQE